ncbi:hypothetical protein [Nostoc sp.]|uniref:hypothetical protein n=1 Tax=Nostoc sp. TaxID=1180 RepID=UPI002FF84B48
MKEEINSIIIKQGLTDIKEENLYIDHLKTIAFSDDTNVFNYHQLTSFENKITTQKTIPKTLRITESNVVSSPVFTCEIGELKKIHSTQKSSRSLGIWKGQVEISEDFYKTSSEILSEFGIEE